MIQQMEATLRAGAVPQARQFSSSMVASVSESSDASFDQLIRTNDDVEGKSKLEPTSCGLQQNERNNVVSPAGEPQETTSNDGLVVDLLGDARSKVQEEISSEFAALMATGTLGASEAAALATKRVMQRYGHMNSAQS